MLSLGLLSFTAPWLLVALAALPILWWLLRVTPPAPRLVRFPAIRLLLRLQEKEDTPAHTPWWLLLLRLLVIALLIIGLAHPLLNASKDFKRPGPILLVIDNGWSSAANWQARRNAVGELLEKAARLKKKVIILTTARTSLNTGLQASKLMLPVDAKAMFQAIIPAAWPVDHMEAARVARRLQLPEAANVTWLSDGLQHTGTLDLAKALLTRGNVTVVADKADDLPLLLHPARLTGTRLVFKAERPVSGVKSDYWLRLIDENGRAIGRRQIAFDATSKTVDVALRLPTELRNRLARIEVERHRSSGATLLLDERLRRRPVGLVSAAKLSDNQPLLSDLFYLERALSPFSEVRKGPVAQLLGRPLSVIFLPDRAPLTPKDRQLLRRWIGKGGVLVRFAGPKLAESSDKLVPVRLRGGNRSFGGPMSWTKPGKLAPFSADSPFAGLVVPSDVTVSRQVLAEPGLDLSRRTWARLSDGTPLVTAAKRGSGMIILFHTTGNPDWSNLAISGLFVDMLRRAVSLSRGVAEGGTRQSSLAPFQVLDGYGRLSAPTASVLPIPLADFEKTRISPTNPPGLYGDKASRRSLNLSRSVRSVSPLTNLPAGVARNEFKTGNEFDLKPWLLAAALILFLLDMLISLFMRGLVPRRVAKTAAVILLAGGAVFGGMFAPTPASAQNSASDEAAIKATKNTVLAYVKTGDNGIDRISRRALIGLGRILRARTSVEPAEPAGVDISTDILAFYPVLYWPVTSGQSATSTETISRLQSYLQNGGMIIFDIREQGGLASGTLKTLIKGLKIPALRRVPDTHVLTRAYYLLQRFPGRWTGNSVWVAKREQTAKDGVSPIIIGANDWAAAWAIDEAGRPMFPVQPGGEYQREIAYRTGVNLIMYALTGNYKADQVHIPTILRRLGQ